MRSFGLMTLCCAYAHAATLPRCHAPPPSSCLSPTDPALLLPLSLPPSFRNQPSKAAAAAFPFPADGAPSRRRSFWRYWKEARGCAAGGGLLTKNLEPVSLLGEEGVNLQKKSAVKNLQQFRSTREEKRRGEKGMNEENNQD